MKKLNQLYAGQKAAITRRYNSRIANCNSPTSVAAYKAVRTREMNRLNQTFGRRGFSEKSSN